MRLLIDYRARDEERRARGEPVAQLGPSPAFANLKWLKPVYAGDSLLRHRSAGNAALNSRPGWGMIFVRNVA